MSTPRGLPTHLRIDGPLDAGGTATVWRARDTRHGRDVAVKLFDLPPGSAPDDAARRLEREVRALARLSGVPGVVSVRECGITGSGLAWTATELLDGGSLDRRSAGASMDWLEVADLGVVLARTLASCHELDVVHGDVSPTNVVFDGAGRPHLVDFGLAWLGDGEVARGFTPAYAAPERLRGAPPSAAADVFSLAVTLLAVAGCDATGELGDPSHPVARVLLDASVQRPSQRPSAAHLADSLRRVSR